MKTLRFCFAIATLAAVAGFNTAYAGDEKIYPGSFCQPDNPSFADSLSYTVAGVKNKSTSKVKVVCPIVRDNTRTTSGPIEVWVTGMRVRPGSKFKNVTDWRCTYFTTNHRGEALSSESRYFDIDVGRVAARFADIASSQAETGHHVLACELPGEATLVEYEVEEL